MIILSRIGSISAQSNLIELLHNNEAVEERVYVFPTFKGTRIINGHSVEMNKKGDLLFLVSHRFGMINSGPYKLFGLD